MTTVGLGLLVVVSESDDVVEGLNEGVKVKRRTSSTRCVQKQKTKKISFKRDVFVKLQAGNVNLILREK